MLRTFKNYLPVLNDLTLPFQAFLKTTKPSKSLGPHFRVCIWLAKQNTSIKQPYLNFFITLTHLIRESTIFYFSLFLPPLYPLNYFEPPLDIFPCLGMSGQARSHSSEMKVWNFSVPGYLTAWKIAQWSMTTKILPHMAYVREISIP